jgi:hypothetical protein
VYQKIIIVDIKSYVIARNEAIAVTHGLDSKFNNKKIQEKNRKK